MNNKSIQDIQKIVLHLHLDGSLRPETVHEWLKEEGSNETLDNVKTKLMVSKDCRNLNEYLEKFDLPLHCLQTEEHLQRASFELFEDLAKQNVKYAEVRFAPSLHTKKGLTYEQIVEATIKGMQNAKSQHEIDGNLILCCMRGNDNKEANLRTVAVAKKYLGKGVCSLDLAGAEAIFKTNEFEDIFALAKKENIPFTIHAGEADGPESIKTALKFGAKRIGHGIRCIEDPNLMNELKRKEIALEICPTSNLQTQAVKGKYPLETLYRNGIITTLNTDNDTVSNTNINEEYEWVLNNTNLNIYDLIQMNINAARASFLPMEKKAALISKISSQKEKTNTQEDHNLR